MTSGSIRSDAAPQLAADGPGLALVADGRRVARVAAAVEAVGEAPGDVTDWRAAGAAWSGASGGLRCRLTVEPVPGGAIASASLVNEGAQPVGLSCFRLALHGMAELWDAAQGSARGLKIAYCGAHSRSRHSRSAVVELDGGRLVRSWWVGALAPRRGGPGIVLGGVDFRRFATAVDLDASGLAAVQFLEGWPLAPGEQLEMAPLWLGVSSVAPLEPLEAYATEVGRRHGVTPREAPCGWGSWGHFLESIDADLMRENLLALEGSDALRGALRMVQIDDGWSEMLESERASASWRPNRRFPSGIAPLAAAVRRSGRDCGLWILPFTVNEGSPLAQAHPEYLVRDKHERPMRVGGGASYCLDPFHRGARDWIVDLLSRLRDWGVAYVKLDHLRVLLMPDPDAADDDLDTVRVHCVRATRVEAYRRGLELVREAVGPDVFLAACSAPAGPGIGLVDSHRVGPDIEPAWVGRFSGIRDTTRALAANFFWQGRTWVNDPDYLLAGATVEESRFWATAVALSGGSAIVSAQHGEQPAWLEEIFATVTPPTGRAARPLDLFARAPEPRFWHLVLGGPGAPWQLVGLFNWDERPGDIVLDLPALGFGDRVHVWDVWRRRHRMASGREAWFVEGHSATLLALREVAGPPQVVGTDVHFAQGASVLEDEQWNASSRTLRLAVHEQLPRPGAAYVWVPDGLRCAQGAALVPGRPDLLQVGLARGSVHELRFAASSSTSMRE